METEVVSVVLAAGRGSRMPSDDLNKVCYEIAGVPAISRALEVYEQSGVTRHIVVVGHLADQVRAEVESKRSNVEFAYQPEPKGTGHAARCGAQPLQEQQYQGAVLLVAGDKVLRGEVVSDLISAMREENADLVFLTGDKQDNPGSGRVLKNERGEPIAIVETAEIALSRLLVELEEMAASGSSVPTVQVLERMRAHFPKESKLQKACPGILQRISDSSEVEPLLLASEVEGLLPKAEITVHREGRQQTIRAHEVEAATDEVNLSVYIFKSTALYEALETLQPANAQGEEYLTDCIKYLASECGDDGRLRFSLKTVKLSDPQACMGFNTLEELQKIREYYSEVGDN
ncbi:MAG: NTP transferase domain-containing protein [Armatimonadia bacterium]